MEAISATTPVDGSALPARVQSRGSHRLILESALQLFAERGYHGVSVRDIARATHLSVSSIYGHFPAKEQILAELVLAGITEHHEQLTSAVAAAGTDPETAVRALVTAHIDVHLSLPTLARVADRERKALSDANHAAVMETHQATTDLFTDLIDRGRAEGRFRLRNTGLAVAAIGAMGLRLADWWSPDLGYDRDALMDEYVGFAMRVLGAADETDAGSGG
jgi:AcrR family transcriptional regulator